MHYKGNHACIVGSLYLKKKLMIYLNVNLAKYMLAEVMDLKDLIKCQQFVGFPVRIKFEIRNGKNI